MPTPTGNPIHDANVLAAEQQRQQAFGPLNLQDNSNWPGHVSVPAPPVSGASALAAEVAYNRRCVASALATGVSPVPFLTALRAAGQSLYP